MTYRSLESTIRGVVQQQNIDEAALGDHKGLQALAKRKTGEEKNVMMRAADMMRQGQIKDLNMFMKAMDQSTHKAIMPYVDKKHYKALHEDIEDLNEAEPTGLKIYHKDKQGKEGHVIVFTARDAQRRHNEIKKAGYTATHHALMYGTKEGPKKPIKEEFDLDFLDEKKLTSAELKKREEIAKAIERENPDMPMDKKMAIATAQAKKVAEDREDKVLDFLQSLSEEVQINEAVDDEGKMARGQLMRMAKQAAALGNMMSDDKQLDGWVQSKLTKASDYLDSVHDYLMNNKQDVDEEVIDESSKFTDKQIKMAYGVLNDPRYKRGNLTGAANAIEKIAKGLTKHPGVKKAMYATQEQVGEAFGREALQKNYEKITKDKTGETLQQRRDWYKKNAEAVKKRMQQNEESLDEVRGGADEPDKHIIMQLRKAQDVDGNHPIGFRGGKTAKVAKKHIDKILKAHDHPTTKPVAKRLMRVAISKSPEHLARFADKLKEEKDDDGREVIHTRKADFKLSKVRLPDGRMVYRKVKKEVDIEK